MVMTGMFYRMCRHCGLIHKILRNGGILLKIYTATDTSVQQSS